MWGLYSQAPIQVLEEYLTWTQSGYSYVSDDFRAMADQNREASTQARTQVISQLIYCQSAIYQRLSTDVDLDDVSDKFWVMLGSTVPQRDIEVHTALTCNRLAVPRSP